MVGSLDLFERSECLRILPVLDELTLVDETPLTDDGSSLSWKLTLEDVAAVNADERFVPLVFACMCGGR